MKVIILGSGTSTGVPRIGNDWGLCDPNEPKNRRTRASIIVENMAGSRILVDTSTDLRHQLLANNIDKVDAVFWTHDHADHTHGIDDLRPMRYGRSGPLPGYATEETVRRLQHRFDYVFEGQFGYHTIVELSAIDRIRVCAGFGVNWCKMPHGPAKSTAFKFDADGKTIGYATDFSEITSQMLETLAGCDLLVVDCLRREAHPTHANLTMALKLAKKTKAKKAILTHLDKSMDYVKLSEELPSNVFAGYDGLIMHA